MSGTGSTTLNNKYKPGGGGIGASSVAIRRAKNRLSTVCDSQSNTCGAFYNRLGLYARNPSGYVPSSSKPGAPILNTLTPSTSQLILNFTLGADGGSAITNMEYSTDNGATWTITSQTTSPLTVTGLANGRSYDVIIRAKNAVGTGASSNMVQGTLIAVAPSAPTLNTLTPTDTHLILNFTLGSDGGSPITDIEYSTNNGTTWTSSNKTTSPVVITGLTNGTSYQVIIRAINAVKVSPSSNTLSGTPNPVIATYSAVQTTTWVAPAGVTSVEYLVVGGGGGSGGGFNTGGGGGGGGGMVLTGTLSVTPGTSYNLIVGNGGEGGISIRDQPPSIPNASETNGTAGDNSVFGSIVALSGGGGYGSRSAPGGASAGGNQVSGVTASTGGNGGGSVSDGNGAGGGGGGNASNGSNGVLNVGGNGGAGLSNSIGGTSVTYGAGGRGANGNTLNESVAGAANTGNGARGGGTGGSNQTPGAKGGSGIVIIKF